MKPIKQIRDKKEVAASRSPGLVDHEIGMRMRLRREHLRLSTEAVAERLGISAAQVRKYEQGINRVGAGRLMDVAEILQAPLMWFLDGELPEQKKEEAADNILDVRRDLTEQLGILIAEFIKLDDVAAREAVLEFTKHLVAIKK